MQTHIQVLSEDEKAQVHERTLKVLSTVGMRCDTADGRRILADAGARRRRGDAQGPLPAGAGREPAGAGAHQLHRPRPPAGLELLRAAPATSRCWPTAAPPRCSTRGPASAARPPSTTGAPPRALLDASTTSASTGAPSTTRPTTSAPAASCATSRTSSAPSASTCRTRSARRSWRRGSRRCSTSCSAGPQPVRERMPHVVPHHAGLAADHRARLHADVAGAARLRPAGGGDADAAAGRHGARQPSRHAARRQLRDDRDAVPGPGGGARARRCSTRPWWRPWTRARVCTPPVRSSTRCSASPAPRWPATTACRPSPRASARRPTSRTCRPPGRRPTAGCSWPSPDPDVLVGPGLLGGATVLCLEQIVLDVEMIRGARQAHAGIPVRDDLWLDEVMDKVGPCGSFLGERSTRHGRPQRRVAPQRLRRAGQLGRVAGGGVARHRRRRRASASTRSSPRRSRCRTARTRRRPSRRCSAAPTPPPDPPPAAPPPDRPATRGVTVPPSPDVSASLLGASDGRPKAPALRRMVFAQLRHLVHE